MPERAVGQNRVGMPSARPSGSGRSRPRAQTEAPRAGDRHERVGEPDLAAQVDRLGPAAEEAVGAQVDDAAAEVVAAQGAAEAGRRLEHDDRGCVAAAVAHRR